MKILAIISIVLVVVATVAAAFCVVEGAQAAIIAAAGFGVLLFALCLYVLADIRILIQKGKSQ